jgi:crossover junction endodeoxyribonuclease RuvC
MNDILYIGIDPGKSGGIALISDLRIRVYAYSDDILMDCLKTAREWGDINNVIACVEKVGAMPGQGVVSMFSFGRSLGIIEGGLMASGIPYQLVPPRTWKKEFSLTSDKQQSIEVCQKLYPHISLLATERCRKPHDGMAEALLMATYCKRKM